MNSEPCLKCNRPVDITRRHWRVHLIYNRGTSREVDMGWHTIGPECRKHYQGFEIERTGPLHERTPS